MYSKSSKAKSLALLLVVLSFSFSAVASNKHALLIGIGQYPSSSGWKVIDGDKDIPLVKRALIRQGFKDKEITTLINDHATKSGIVSAMTKLAEESRKGDLVYIHFSGHGQQISDIDGDEKKDGSDYDEAWIPYDACLYFKRGVYEGQNHLVDDEINDLLYAISEKVGKAGRIVVVADACHSEGGTRGLEEDDEPIVRGVPDEFIIPKSEWAKMRRASAKHVRLKTDPWIFIAACSKKESNYEYKASDGQSYGVLSYVIANDSRIFSSLNASDIFSGWMKMYEELRSQSTRRIPPQKFKMENAENYFNSTLF